MSHRFLFVLVAALTWAAHPVLAEDNAFVIIVNVANPTATLTRAELENIYLKRKTNWSDGASIRPLDLPEGNSIRVAFSQEILKKSPADLKRFWQQQIFSGRDQPPHKLPSVAEVLRNVNTSKEAIGYVPASTQVKFFRGIKTVPVE